MPGGAQIGQGIGGIASIIGGMFPQKTSQNTNSTGTTNTSGETNTNSQSQSQSLLETLLNTISNLTGKTSGTSTSAQTLSPQAQQLLNQLTQSYGALSKPVDLRGYQAQQIAGISNTADLAKQAAQESLAARGLSTSPVAATTNNQIDANKFAQTNQFNQQIPLLQDTLTQQHLQGASNFFNTIPRGTTTTNEQSQEQQQQQQQTGRQSGSNFGQNWGYQGTQGSQNTTQNSTTTNKTGGGIGGILGGLAGVAGTLGSLFSDKRLKENISTKEALSSKAIDRVMALKPAKWTWKADGSEDQGFIAQDVLKVLPHLVHKDPEGSGFYKVNYAGLISEVVSAIQDIKTEGVTI